MVDRGSLRRRPRDYQSAHHRAVCACGTVPASAKPRGTARAAPRDCGVRWGAIDRLAPLCLLAMGRGSTPCCELEPDLLLLRPRRAFLAQEVPHLQASPFR